MAHRTVTEQITQPAAGHDWAFTPSSGDRVRLLSLTAELVTSAAAANRIVALALKDQSGLVYWSTDAVNPQAASLTVRYNWSRGPGLTVASTVVTGERIGLSLPDLWLQPGDVAESITGAIDTADQWSNIVWRGIVADYWEDEERIAAFAQMLHGYGG